MKSTQLAYPSLAQLDRFNATPTSPKLLDGLPLMGKAKSEGELHHMRDGAVVLYRRANSKVWQVRFKLYDSRWHRFSTKRKELAYAKREAADLYDRARFKEEMGLPIRTKRFAAVADECLKQLDREIEQGLKPSTNDDYKRVIRRYLLPFFGKYNITSLDSKLVREFEIWRNEKIGRMPKASTLMTHASAYNRVIETAIEQGWLNKHQNIPTLSRRGEKTKARPGFTVEEVNQLLEFMPKWVSDANGKVCLAIKYGARTIELAKGKTAIEVASAEALIAALTTVNEAVLAGELDTQIEALSGQIRGGFQR